MTELEHSLETARDIASFETVVGAAKAIMRMRLVDIERYIGPERSLLLVSSPTGVSSKGEKTGSRGTGMLGRQGTWRSSEDLTPGLLISNFVYRDARDREKHAQRISVGSGQVRSTSITEFRREVEQRGLEDELFAMQDIKKDGKVPGYLRELHWVDMINHIDRQRHERPGLLAVTETRDKIPYKEQFVDFADHVLAKFDLERLLCDPGYEEKIRHDNRLQMLLQGDRPIDKKRTTDSGSDKYLNERRFAAAFPQSAEKNIVYAVAQALFELSKHPEIVRLNAARQKACPREYQRVHEDLRTKLRLLHRSHALSLDSKILASVFKDYAAVAGANKVIARLHLLVEPYLTTDEYMREVADELPAGVLAAARETVRLFSDDDKAANRMLPILDRLSQKDRSLLQLIPDILGIMELTDEWQGIFSSQHPKAQLGRLEHEAGILPDTYHAWVNAFGYRLVSAQLAYAQLHTVDDMELLELLALNTHLLIKGLDEPNIEHITLKNPDGPLLRALEFRAIDYLVQNRGVKGKLLGHKWVQEFDVPLLIELSTRLETRTQIDVLFELANVYHEMLWEYYDRFKEDSNYKGDPVEQLFIRENARPDREGKVPLHTVLGREVPHTDLYPAHEKFATKYRTPRRELREREIRRWCEHGAQLHVFYRDVEDVLETGEYQKIIRAYEKFVVETNRGQSDTVLPAATARMREELGVLRYFAGESPKTHPDVIKRAVAIFQARERLSWKDLEARVAVPINAEIDRLVRVKNHYDKIVALAKSLKDVPELDDYGSYIGGYERLCKMVGLNRVKLNDDETNAKNKFISSDNQLMERVQAAKEEADRQQQERREYRELLDSQLETLQSAVDGGSSFYTALDQYVSLIVLAKISTARLSLPETQSARVLGLITDTFPDRGELSDKQQNCLAHFVTMQKEEHYSSAFATLLLIYGIVPDMTQPILSTPQQSALAGFMEEQRAEVKAVEKDFVLRYFTEEKLKSMEELNYWADTFGRYRLHKKGLGYTWSARRDEAEPEIQRYMVSRQRAREIIGKHDQPRLTLGLYAEIACIEAIVGVDIMERPGYEILSQLSQSGRDYDPAVVRRHLERMADACRAVYRISGDGKKAVEYFLMQILKCRFSRLEKILVPPSA